jgi:hypothetical protein
LRITLNQLIGHSTFQVSQCGGLNAKYEYLSSCPTQLKETIKSSSTEMNLEQEELADPNGNIALCQKVWNLVRSGKYG